MIFVESKNKKRSHHFCIDMVLLPSLNQPLTSTEQGFTSTALNKEIHQKTFSEWYLSMSGTHKGKQPPDSSDHLVLQLLPGYQAPFLDSKNEMETSIYYGIWQKATIQATKNI